MSDQTPPPPPPLPRTPAEEAARAAVPAPAAAPAYDPATDPDDTGVPTLAGDVDDIGRGFFRALFDLSFKTFITRRLASVFYLAGLVVIAIGFVVYLVSGITGGVRFFPGNVGAGISLIVATVILVPLFAFLAVVVLRFVIESVVALIAIAENTQQTADNTEKS
ncbi:DUF4282 domain-containing protein [Microbacterium ulmi]|uniref:DUF4282 domain-containing protein n=1 Tax=Microbacterium ulmi TaxID=179095 RepID=A0A7Y2M3M3_9MICO|nr:DUF4282 domain-containing protein [Microbacterium ulmi]NII70500.1 putative membrane protein [Microbacterium ulmi]NNH04488.1 DUF4282 domain-containing protein [Microbacterium ulmi]